jgi:formate dehydrogenase major subunit
VEDKTVAKVAIDGIVQEARPDELLIDLINRAGVSIPHVCYHPQLGPVQTCDTCMVEVNGRLVRACATEVADGMKISTKSAKASVAQVEAFDRILSNHLLYCTVCDNNNGNCTVHNTTKMLAIEHQRIPFRSKPYEVDNTNPFYRYDPDQCILCGRCVEACQNVEVNETLSINWEPLPVSFASCIGRRLRVERFPPATHEAIRLEYFRSHADLYDQYFCA